MYNFNIIYKKKKKEATVLHCATKEREVTRIQKMLIGGRIIISLV
jgi:hypothetical protein